MMPGASFCAAGKAGTGAASGAALPASSRAAAISHDIGAAPATRCAVGDTGARAASGAGFATLSATAVGFRDTTSVLATRCRTGGLVVWTDGVDTAAASPRIAGGNVRPDDELARGGAGASGTWREAAASEAIPGWPTPADSDGPGVGARERSA
jgi:hypothetical protein